jgi:TonB family protein
VTRALLALLLLAAASASAQQADDVLDAGLEVLPPTLVQPSPALFPLDAGTAGEVELLLTIDDKGLVTDVQVQSSTGEAFTQSATAAARSLVFEPATQNGAPVAVVLAYRYRFEAPVFEPDAGPPPEFGTLRGTVFTLGTREVVPLAQVQLEDGGVTAVETDAEGRFTLELPPGPRRVVVTASNHVRKVFKENLAAGQVVQVKYRLARLYSKPYETIVRGQVDRAELSRITLSGAELREVAGTSGEPLRVIMLLPGVVTPASGLSYPVVRGALPAATGFYLDGVRVPQLYHLLAGGSVVHPEFIESIDFYPANAPTRFGRISGGVISAQVAKARDDRVHFTIQPDLIQTSAFVEVPIAKTGTNITLGGHVNYAAWLLGLMSAAGAFGQGITPVVESWDYQARIEQKIGKGNLRLLAFGSNDLIGTRQANPDQPSVFLTSRFQRIDLRGQYPIGPGQLEVGSYIGWETFGLYGEQNKERVGSFLLNRFIATGRVMYRLDLGDHFQLKAGFDVERQVTDVETTIGIGSGGDLLRQPRNMGVFTGTFLEGAFIADKFTAIAGVRVDTWHLAPSYTIASVDPRVELRYRPNQQLMFRANAGLAHQAPMLLISLPVTDVGALRDGLHEVGQFSLGAVGKLPWLDMEVSVDGFYNHIFQARERSLAEFVTGISSLDDRFAGNRWGRAYGLEVMVRLPQQGRIFGWLSYALMRSERQRRFAVYNEDQSVATDTVAMVPFAFDQAHSLNLVLGYQLPKGFKVSASFHLNTGRPESGEFSSRTQRLVDDSLTGRRLWSIVPLNEVDRLPAFARLDVRASKAISFNELQVEIFLDVFNVLVRPEVYGYTYSYGTETDPTVPTKTELGAPIILPTLGVKVVY